MIVTSKGGLHMGDHMVLWVSIKFMIIRTVASRSPPLLAPVRSSFRKYAATCSATECTWKRVTGMILKT